MGEDQAQPDNKVSSETVVPVGAKLIYAHGFTLGLTNADMNIVLHLFGRPIAVVNISYTLAKTLAIKLTELVAEWERKTGQTLVTTDKIDEVFGEERK